MLLIKSGPLRAFNDWIEQFARFAPGLEVRHWDDPEVDPAQVHFALVWEPTPGRLATFPNLKLIMSTAAGVDHIFSDPDLPKGVPVTRMSVDESRQGMAEFVAMMVWVLRRNVKTMVEDQQARRWKHVVAPTLASQLRVGVLGQGYIGSHTAQYLHRLGFVASGWSRSGKDVEGVRSFAGEAQFEAFLSELDTLVCLLPETPQTRGILNARTFAALPRGAMLINVGRGGHLVEDDLLAALDSGQLSAACLDVFDKEPLPTDSPLWSHPRILISPHAASTAGHAPRAQRVSELLRIFESGASLPDLCDPARGY